MYWKALFDENNLKNVIYKLNGSAEIFFREKSISKENEIVHYANQPIKNKNPHAIKREVILPYDVLKDKRFCIDKFQLHIPITLNFKATGKGQLNSDVLQYLKDTPQNQVKVIGIDRGERHLLYLTMIDHEGHIIMQESLNTVKSVNYPIETQYHDLLAQKEEDRNKARSNWDSIENIKELKEGYLSQVVHKLAKLIVENNAVLVMEDLNIGFKRGRFKVEKQVYQKFEKALIDKLNYLVFKDKKVEEEGGLFKALQLTEPYTDFLKYKKKQCGFLFYVQAWNTSKIDPTTGFIDMLKPKYKNIPEAQEFFRKFISIKYNSDKDYFEFHFDYRNFPRSIDSHKNDWTVCTYGKERYVWNRSLNQGNGDYEIWNLTEKIKELFNIEGIEYRSGHNLTEAIANSESKSLLSMLMKSLSVVLAMRYSSSKDNRDFILSPVANDKGVFYYSEEADQYLPKDADANGAYNIARKGLLLLDRIRSSADLKSLKLDIANKEWLMHAQK
jgi:CRISPR-associated protein Cpf1